MIVSSEVAALEKKVDDYKKHIMAQSVQLQHQALFVTSLKRIKSIAGSTGGPEAVAAEMRTIADLALAHAGIE